MLSVDGKVYAVLTFLYKCLLLNLLFLLSCVPIVSIPASIAAIFAVVRKLIGHDDVSIFQVFWRSFRENFIQCWLVTLIFGVIGLIIRLDYRFLIIRHSGFNMAGIIVLGFISIAAISILTHAFPVMVHLKLKTGALLLTAAKLTLVKPHLTIFNLLVLSIWSILAIRVTILLPTLFFSLSAACSYWVVDNKFKMVIAVQNLDSKSS